MNINMILEVVAVLLVVGVLLWGITSWPAIDSTIAQIIKVIVVVVAALWIIQLLLPMRGLAH